MGLISYKPCGGAADIMHELGESLEFCKAPYNL